MPSNASHDPSPPGDSATGQHQVIPFPRTVSVRPGVDTGQAGPALARLYGNLYASLAQFEFSGGLEDCSPTPCITATTCRRCWFSAC
jgi:hypothetical protein